MSTLDELLKQTKMLVEKHRGNRVEPMQAISWAYGNLACSTNHMPVRECFLKLALERGISQDEFDRWAAGRSWRVPGAPEVKCEICGAVAEMEPPKGEKVRCQMCIYWSRPWRALEE